MLLKRPETAGEKGISCRINRRRWLQVLIGGWLAAAAPGSGLTGAEDEPPGQHFDFAAVKRVAEKLARRPFKSPRPCLRYLPTSVTTSTA